MRTRILTQTWWILMSMLTFTSGFAQQPLVYQDDPGRFIPEKLVDIEHLSAAIQIDPYQQLVQAEVEFLFRQTRDDIDSLVLLAPAFDFEQITLNKKPVEWHQDGENLVVHLPNFTKNGSTYALYLKYTVKPASELFFIGWDDTTHTMRRQIWAHRPFNWLPYANDRLTVDMYITFDSRYQVFSNGVRESIEHHDEGTSTWHYKMYRSHPFFSTALVIGDYRYKQSQTSKGLPVELWYYPDRADHFEATYQHMFEMINFCETEFGVPYPYELYRQVPVANYLYGAMETTTSTIFGDYMHIDERAFWERNYVNVNAHELTHQWFGNYISHIRPKDVWLTESFATYYAKMFERQLYGENYYQWERQKESERCLKASEKDSYAVGNSRGGSDRWYPKGSMVLDMLRDEMGDKNFRRSITHYLKAHAYDEAWTPDLQKAIYATTGQSMDWFFEQWIERGGEPHLRIEMQQEPDCVVLTINQTQEISAMQPAFHLKTVVDFYFNDGSKERLVMKIDSAQSKLCYNYPNDKKLAFVVFDPGDRILKSQDFKRPFEMLASQLQKAPLMIDRYEALCAMDTFSLDEKREVLSSAYQRNDFHLIQAEVLRQLASDTLQSSIHVFRDALTDTSVLVRRAALTNLGFNHLSLVPEIETCLFDFSYGNQELALRKLALLNKDRLSGYLLQTKDEMGFPGLNVHITWLELATEIGDSSAIAKLVAYAGPRFEFRTRINAIEALGQMNYLDNEFASNLVDAACHWNFRLRPVAITWMKKYLEQDDKRALLITRIETLEPENKTLLLKRMQ